MVVDIADTRSLFAMRRCLAPGGRYSLIARRLGSFASSILLAPLLGRAAGVRMGTILWKPNQARMLGRAARRAARLRRRAADRRQTWSLDDAAGAFRHLSSGRARGKVVITP